LVAPDRARLDSPGHAGATQASPVRSDRDR